MPQVACSDRRGIRAGFIPDGRAASPKFQTALYRNRWEIKGKRAVRAAGRFRGRGRVRVRRKGGSVQCA
ncbi:hypothetical protein B1A90_02060 [Neisseria meningitidis]|nr:hypothetical protein B1A90_02060 [Neisseria meningitidis]